MRLVFFFYWTSHFKTNIILIFLSLSLPKSLDSCHFFFLFFKIKRLNNCHLFFFFSNPNKYYPFNKDIWGNCELPFMFGVVHNSLIYLWNQPISPFMFEKWANTPDLLLSQLSLTRIFKEIISCTPQGREKIENCIIVFLNCICNHCNFIGFNWKSNGLGVFAHFPNIEGEIDRFQR